MSITVARPFVGKHHTVDYDSGHSPDDAATPHRGAWPPTALWYRRCVTDHPAEDVVYDVTCPHCGKEFRGELLTGGAARYTGFKCPHCRLFVPYERADEQDLVEPAG